MALQENVYKEITKTKTGRRMFFGVLIILTIILIYKIVFTPVDLWGAKFNQNLIIHDTTLIVKNFHDTVTIIKESPNQKNQPAKTNVSSYDQKGGQTAKEITNINQ